MYAAKRSIKRTSLVLASSRSSRAARRKQHSQPQHEASRSERHSQQTQQQQQQQYQHRRSRREEEDEQQAERQRDQHWSAPTSEPRGRYSPISSVPPTNREHIKELEKIKVNPHVEPRSMSDRVAGGLVRGIVGMVEMTFPKNLLRQAAMMETLGPVPGMVGTVTHRVRAAITRKPCQWAEPSMGEARREFVHFRSMLNAANAGFFFRFLALGQHAMWALMYMPFYLLAPRTAHRFNGYLEEAAVNKYTQIIEAIDSGHIRNVAAPPVAMRAWNLPSDATLRDVALLIRADEADFREVHHHMTELLSGHRDSPKACDEFHIDLSPAGSPNLHLDDPDTSRVHVSEKTYNYAVNRGAASSSSSSSSSSFSASSYSQQQQSEAPRSFSSRPAAGTNNPSSNPSQEEAPLMSSGSSEQQKDETKSVPESMHAAMNPAEIRRPADPKMFDQSRQAGETQKVAGDSLSREQTGEPANPANEGAAQAEDEGELPRIKSVQTSTSVFASPVNTSHQAGEPADKRKQSPEERSANANASRPRTDRAGKHQTRQHARAFCALCQVGASLYFSTASASSATSATQKKGGSSSSIKSSRRARMRNPYAHYQQYVETAAAPAKHC